MPPLPLYGSIEAAETARIPAGIKAVRVQVEAPFPQPPSPPASAEYVRARLEDVMAKSFPGAAVFRSADRYQPNGAEDPGGGYWLLNEEVVTPYMFGAVPGEDAVGAIRDVIAYLSARGGGRMDGLGATYLLNSGGVVVNANDIVLENFVFQRSTATTGWLVQFARDRDTQGGGVRNARFVGLPVVSGGNGGLAFGSAEHAANRYVAQTIDLEGFSQYGMGVANGSDWRIDNIRVAAHGLVNGAIGSCIGFWIFPRMASANGHLSNVHAEISAACQANQSANAAALKLQTHQNLTAYNITAVGGSEEAMAIDSVSGQISNVRVLAQGTNAGLAVGNYNPVHAFSGQTFVLDGFEVLGIDGTSSVNNFVIGGGAEGVHKLTGCTIKNGKGGGAGYLAYSATRDCTFENLDFEDLRFDAAGRGFAVNSVASTNNRYVNVVARGGVRRGVLFIEATDSVFDGCGVAAAAGHSVGTFQLRGSRNILRDVRANNVRGNAVTILGSDNRFDGIRLGVVSGRSIWFQPGSGNNVITSADVRAGQGVLNDGSSSNRIR